MKRFWRNNSLSVVMLGMFFILFIFGQACSGWLENNEDRTDHGLRAQSIGEYLTGAHFLEATTENWESEFLQMGIFVWCTVFLYQKGSAESKDPDKREEVDRDPRRIRDKSGAPWPVRRGGLVLKIYENSLTLIFLFLFLTSFVLHGVSGRSLYNEEQALHGQPAVSVGGYMTSSRFWFESFQNWQSEFLAIGCMVVFSIYLRQKGSPESKPVDAPHTQTGG
ncbi:MAG TPA: DUF6766 family protein [Chthoniobacterales bacterium]|jgi:hypothetical protein|nr:DUF6766 family protein [Chthoniobacterales bacterium]